MSIGLIDAERRLDHSRDDGAALVVSLDATIVQTVVLGPRPLTIGRLPENALVLAAPDVSRQHAEVRLEPDGFVATVTDLGSSGGTSVAGTALLPDQPFKLEDGMVIRIGPFDLTYVAASVTTPASAGSTPTVVPSVPPAPPVASTRQAAWSPISNLPIDDFLEPVQARPRFPAPLPATLRSQYLRHLPSIFDDGGLDPLKATGEPIRRPNGELLIGADGEPLRRNQAFLGRMLVIFEALWEPLEQRQDHIAMYFDPRTCPAEMLSWLAGWLDVTLDAHWPEDRRRSLLAEAMELFRWRGTAYGLTRIIEVSTGLTAVITDDAEPFVIRVRVSIPSGSGVRRDVLETLIREHKPAHVGYVLETS
jgi:phage tail-like protein